MRPRRAAAASPNPDGWCARPDRTACPCRMMRCAPPACGSPRRFRPQCRAVRRRALHAGPPPPPPRPLRTPLPRRSHSRRASRSCPPVTGSILVPTRRPVLPSLRPVARVARTCPSAAPFVPRRGRGGTVAAFAASRPGGVLVHAASSARGHGAAVADLAGGPRGERRGVHSADDTQRQGLPAVLDAQLQPVAATAPVAQQRPHEQADRLLVAGSAQRRADGRSGRVRRRRGFRPGLRKRSNTSPYCVGSMPVTPRQSLGVAEGAGEPFNPSAPSRRSIPG